MKNQNLARHYQSARIYRRHYKSSFNIFRLLKSVFAVLFLGSAPVANHTRRK